MNGDPARPRVGAFAGEPVRPEFDFTPSTSGWLPPPRMELGVPDYGVDSPGLVLRAFGFATLAALAAVAAGGLRPAFSLASLAGAAFGASRLAYAKRGKLALRDRLLGLITWTGAERVLDVGTGGGLLMIGAAKRLTTGKAVGIDSWRQDDLTHNTRESAMRNAYFEGVVEKVDVRYEDARKLGTCTRNSFDVVFAVMTFRHIGDAAAPLRAKRSRASSSRAARP
jgi:SAM-dependent methyltransferase